MSSIKDKCKVNMARVLRSDQTTAITYTDKVTIKIVVDVPRSLKYLRLESDGQSIFLQEFSELEWVHDSSAAGVAAIRSSRSTILILYDANNESLVGFFNDLQKSLTYDSHPRTITDNSVSWQSKQDQLESMVNHFIESISSGALDQVEYITRKLIELQANVQFKLINKNNNQEDNMVQSKLNSDALRSQDSVLRLSLRIECAWEKDSIIAPIDVRSGTTLQSLKQQIETETGIKYADQYWFAFDRYPISNEYIFGSSGSVVSNRIKHGALAKPIRSGDMLTMYIAQMSSIH